MKALVRHPLLSRGTDSLFCQKTLLPLTRPSLRRGYQTKEAMSGAPVKEEVAAEPAPAPAPAAEPGEAVAPPAAATPVTAVTPISAAPQQPPAAPLPAMGISGAQMPAALPAQVRPPAPPAMVPAATGLLAQPATDRPMMPQQLRMAAA